MHNQPLHPRVIYGFVLLAVVALMHIAGFQPTGTIPLRFGHRIEASAIPGLCACIAVFLLFTGWREMRKGSRD